VNSRYPPASVTKTTIDALHYSADAALRDGGSIHIRSIGPDDRERLHEHFLTLSPHSVYTRFFGTKTELTPAELSYYTEMDGTERVGLVATLGSGASETIVGVGRYFRQKRAGERHRAEVAFAVSDEHQHRGIASALLVHLARIGRAAGIGEFVAEVLAENRDMLRVFAESGYEVTRSIDHGVFHVTFPIGVPLETRK
jgi:ribosomal protein S18 acetylase RimI-like enzyme